MRYWLTTDQGQVTGPYTIERLRQMRVEGKIAPSAMTCAEGSETWEPAATLLGPSAPVQPTRSRLVLPPEHVGLNHPSMAGAPVATERRTGFGLASAVLAGLAAAGTLATYVVEAVMLSNGQGNIDVEDPSPAVFGVACVGCTFLSAALTSLGLGIAALCMRNQAKALPILGIILSVVTLGGSALTELIMVLGGAYE